MMMQLDGEMPRRQKDEAPGQSEQYPTVDNPTRTMADGMLLKGAVKYFQEECQWTACKTLSNLSKS